MAQDSKGLQQANDQSAGRRDEAKEQGLAEQNVTGASPPDVGNGGSPPAKAPHPQANPPANP